ncbi:MAG TPA: DciA family protein [Caulobacteraceae bacterium]|nr:DciA family protein [Caulobacteraceae bacterium]
MVRPLPSLRETADILARRRTRPPRRPPPPAGRALTPLVRAFDQRFGRGADGLAARWREVVGDAVAARSEPVRIVKGRAGAPAFLELRVDGPSATLIAHEASAILARVNLFLGKGSVERLRVVQAPLRGRPVRSHRPKQARRAPAPPLDAAREAELTAMLSDIGPARLRQALQRLGREVLANRGR